MCTVKFIVTYTQSDDKVQIIGALEKFSTLRGTQDPDPGHSASSMVSVSEIGVDPGS